MVIDARHLFALRVSLETYPLALASNDERMTVFIIWYKEKRFGFLRGAL